MPWTLQLVGGIGQLRQTRRALRNAPLREEEAAEGRVPDGVDRVPDGVPAGFDGGRNDRDCNVHLHGNLMFWVRSGPIFFPPAFPNPGGKNNRLNSLENAYDFTAHRLQKTCESLFSIKFARIYAFSAEIPIFDTLRRTARF